nr:immunoglobulin heavy chain junction region [Mus musculus]
CARGYYVFAYW